MERTESSRAPESPKVADLLHQLREAATPDARRDVMVKTILAGRNSEISVTEGRLISAEFSRINSEAQARLKKGRARLKGDGPAD